MSRRHGFQAGEWASIARRLDELISAACGEDAFEEARKLVVAALVGPDGSVDERLERARRRWPGILDADERSLLGPEAAARCEEVLRGAPLVDDDLAGLDAVFECIVARAGKGAKGQFFTPRYVVDALVGMVAPRAGERVLDPACGSGAFLWHARRAEPLLSVAGWDVDARALRAARVLLAVSGADPRVLVRRDALAGAVTAEWDVVLTNPPFAGDVGPDTAARFELGRPRIEREVLFLERAVSLLRPGGRLGIVLPWHVFGSRRLAFVREWLLARVSVRAVVGLARHTFQPHTSQVACLLVATNSAPDGRPILFATMERDPKDASGRVRLVEDRPDSDLPEITRAVRVAMEG